MNRQQNSNPFFAGCCLVFVIPLICTGCASHRPVVTKGIEEPNLMEAKCTSIIHPGMSIEEVTTVMESEGFKCRVYRNKQFEETRSLAVDGVVHEGIDFVCCTRKNSAGILMERCWAVGAVLEGDHTTGQVLVSHFIDGP